MRRDALFLGNSMTIRLVLAVLVACGLLIKSSPLLAEDNYGLLSPAEKRVYHACLYAHWIDSYCRFHAWGYNELSFRDCVIANDGCKCVIANGGYWGPTVDDACRVLYHERVR